MRDAGEECQVADSDIAGDLDLLVVVDAEGDHAVDVGWPQPGVIDRGLDRFARELHLAAAGLLGEFGLADSHEGGFAAKPAGHASTPVEQTKHRGSRDVVAKAVGAFKGDFDESFPVGRAICP